MAKASEAGRKEADPDHSASDARIHIAPPTLGLARLTLGQKLWAAIALFLALWLLHLLVAVISGSDIRDLTGVVDDAGRLRMLSQRIVVEAQRTDLSPAQRRILVSATRDEAAAVLSELQDKAIRLSSQQRQPGIRAGLADLEAGWSLLGQSATTMASGEVASTSLREASTNALTLAERLVQDIRLAQAERQRVLDLLRNGIYMLGALLLVFLGISVHRGGVRPLRALARMAADLQRGRLTTRVDYPARDEVGQLAATLNHAAQRIDELLSSLAAQRDAVAEERRRESLLFEHGADGLLIVDQSMRILRANPEAHRIFGYDDHALVGRDLSVLVPEPQREQHRALVQDYFARPWVRAMGSNMRIRGERADGSMVPVDIRLAPLEVGGHRRAIAAVRDVSTEREHEAVRDRLAGILEVTSDLVLVARHDGTLSYANAAAQVALGIDASRIGDHSLRDLLTAKARRRLDDRALPQSGEHGRWLGILSFRGRDGQGMIPVSSVLVCRRDEAGGVESYSLIARDISAELRHKRELQHQATHDALTGLPNRTVFEDRLDQELRRARRNGTACAVVFVDLDNFKLVNDSLGHAAGDELLQVVGRRLEAVARDADTVVRFGGDEFAMVLPEIGDEKDAAALAERLLEHVARPVTVSERHLAVTVSVGIALYPTHADDMETLTMRADTAMFRAKELGRNQFAIYTGTADESDAVNELDLRAVLPAALVRGEFELHYQTLVDGPGTTTTGAEALIRWRRPEGLLSPAAFIPAAERQKLMGEVCAWTLHAACHQGQQWLQAGHDLDYVAVNISATQIREDHLTESVIEALDHSGLPPEKLELELTETAVLEYHEQASVLFNRLRAVGVRLAIDDFGAGYSGLRYLAALPVDKIKLDRSLISQHRQRHIRVLLQAIIDMAHQLGATVTAEGIETVEQARMLRMLGCDEMQGFRFSRPVPATEVRFGAATPAAGAPDTERAPAG
ncbi:EAL domain-containing protein [Ectothiorhodospiraceae bacterium WFHF3C12]|nr:EAL domain-containing protein [Ectothiorhodospiraceae bacterium WFHF3C12]